jgi:hypothetical protein
MDIEINGNGKQKKINLSPWDGKEEMKMINLTEKAVRELD